MNETVAWLRERPYYEGQVVDHRVLPGRKASFRALDLESRLESALDAAGIETPYEHQAAAVDAVREGDDAVLATRTASGKSLAYTVPAFERAMDHLGTTLYVGPQVALINDQEETLSALASGLGFGSRVTVDQYTGRLSDAEKRAVRDRQPTVLLTTPDMLHYGLLPHGHRLWDWFLQRLETVVVDEVHEYRGVFGSHVALVLRRLNRLCERFEADPQYVCCSATIGNPVEHAAAVTGRDPAGFRLVDEDTSASGPTHWLLWNPPEYEDSGDGGGWRQGSSASGRRRSPHVESKHLFCDLVASGLQTVVFTPSRQTAERYATECANELRDRGEHDLAAAVGAYQAALTDDRREELEAGLRSGETRGVWSTNALELGVDIGGLDAVVLDTYPGTRMSAFQQAGRAGRGTDPSLVVLVGGEDQLDQYFMARPEEFFAGEPERAIVDPANGELLPDHVRSAARENWLHPDDDRHFGDTFPDLVAHLESAGLLERRATADGPRWTDAGEGSPQHEMSLRTMSDREVRLRDRRNGETLASLPFEDGLRDAHPGAVYHHQGQSYEVVDLDVDTGVAELEPTWADYYTRVLHDKEITVEADRRERTLDARDDVTVRFADVTMRKQITGFERRDAGSGESLGREALDLPETTLETEALYYTVPGDVERAMREAGDERRVADHREATERPSGERERDERSESRNGRAAKPASGTTREAGDFPGGIHAAEHAMISLFPVEILCDRRDVGGLSTPLHPHTGAATIFIYDGHPGGVGLSADGYENVGRHMDRTLAMLRSCPCEDGCPACVQSPHCGNANDPLDKARAIQLLGALRD